MITKLYYSREERVGKLNSDEDRLNYEDFDRDVEKSDESLKAVQDFVNDLVDAQDLFLTATYEEGSGDDELDQEAMVYHRAEMIHAWAMAQAALSKFAWVHRFDGNKAYEELIGCLESGGTTDMRGL